MRVLGAAAITVMGLYAIVQSLSRFNARMLYEFVGQPSALAILSFLPTIALVGLGVFLIHSRERLALRWFPDSHVEFSGKGFHLVRLGVIFLGLFFGIAAASSIILGLFGSIQNYLLFNDTFDRFSGGYDSPGFLEMFLLPILGAIFELSASVFLIFRSSWIADKIWNLPAGDAKKGSAVPTCPSCGTPYDPADYRSDADSRCFVCHQLLDLGAAAWHAKAEMLNEVSRYEEAQKYYDKAIELDPGNADYWNNKAIGLDSLDRHEQAIDSYDEAIRLRPDDAEIWFNRGESLQTIDRIEEAIASYAKAIEIDSCHADAIYNKAELERRLLDG